MSSYTSLLFYRPTPPPRVTGPALRDFVARLSATGLFDTSRPDNLHVKFGRAIDQDSLGCFIDQPDPELPGISTFRSIDWDIDHEGIALNDALRLLANHNRPIYRAMISLGSLREDLVKALQTARLDDGQMNLWLWDCGVHLAPVELSTIGGDESFEVGWMEVSFNGYGYLYPWTARDLTSRAEALEPLHAVEEICRACFPVDPKVRPDLKLRRRMGELWPYERIDLPADWLWGVGETG